MGDILAWGVGRWCAGPPQQAYDRWGDDSSRRGRLDVPWENLGRRIFSGEAAIQESLGRSPRNSPPTGEALKARLNAKVGKHISCPNLLRAFSTKTLFLFLFLELRPRL